MTYNTDAILFDLNGTLYDVERTRRQAEIDVVNYLHTLRPTIPIPEIETTIESIVVRMTRDSERVFKTAEDYERARFLELLSQLDIQDTNALQELLGRYQGPYFTQPITIPDAGLVLNELHRRYQLGIITNGFSTIQRHAINRLGFNDYFDPRIYTSEEAQLYKPDTAFFRYALDHMDINPERCAMVGNEPKSDIEPASELNMFTVLLDRRGNKIIKIEPNATIRELKELLTIF